MPEPFYKPGDRLIFEHHPGHGTIWPSLTDDEADLASAAYQQGQEAKAGELNDLAELLDGFEVDLIHRKQEWEVRYHSEPDIPAEAYGRTFTEALAATQAAEGQK